MTNIHPIFQEILARNAKPPEPERCPNCGDVVQECNGGTKYCVNDACGWGFPTCPECGHGWDTVDHCCFNETCILHKYESI